jgi:DNA processing protein
MPASDREIINWVSLAHSTGVGPKTIIGALEKCGSVEAATKYIEVILNKKGLCLYDKDKAYKELEKIRSHGGDIIIFTDERYPAQLKNTSYPPMVLSVVGNPASLSDILVAVVGSRDATINGKHLAKMFTAELGNYGIYTVSGFALGIDSAAHMAATENGLKTVAVLGSNIMDIYPKENRYLYSKIIDNNGAIISEFFSDEITRKENFPRRNRIISGLARGVLVVEAGEKSGSLITANLALEQGREVFAVPGSLNDRNSTGTNRLIKDGATLITSTQDIIDSLFCFNTVKTTQSAVKGKKLILEDKILSSLNSSGVNIDDILRHIDGDDEAIKLAIMELAAKGLITIDHLNRVLLNPGSN